jgi:hypothetical protein
MSLLLRRFPWPVRLVVGLAIAGVAAFYGSHRGTSHTWMEGKLRDQIDAQIAPRTVSAVHCDVTAPAATCRFTVSGVTYVQHFHLDGRTWRPADQPAGV